MHTTFEQNKKIIEENNQLKDENKRLIIRFSEEFIALKTVVNTSLNELNRQKYLASILPNLPLSTVEDIMRFHEEIKQDEDKRSELVSYIYIFQHTSF